MCFGWFQCVALFHICFVRFHVLDRFCSNSDSMEVCFTHFSLLRAILTFLQAWTYLYILKVNQFKMSGRSLLKELAVKSTRYFKNNYKYFYIKLFSFIINQMFSSPLIIYFMISIKYSVSDWKVGRAVRVLTFI